MPPSSTSTAASGAAAPVPNLKMPKPKSFNGDKNLFSDWFRHVEGYWLFYDSASDIQKILVTCEFMNEGPAATWSGAWTAARLGKSKHSWSWDDFVKDLKETYAPISATADAQARLRLLKQDSTPTDQFLITFSQIVAEAQYTDVTKDTPEADHLIDLLKVNMNPMIVYATEDSRDMMKTRDYVAFVKALKEVGKAVESRYEGEVPTPTSVAPPITPIISSPLEPMSPPHSPFSTPPEEIPTISLPTSSGPGECRDATGTTYEGEGQPMDTGRVRRCQVCYNCGQSGHFSNNCPRPRTTRAQQIRNMVLELDEDERHQFAEGL